MLSHELIILSHAEYYFISLLTEIWNNYLTLFYPGGGGKCIKKVPLLEANTDLIYFVQNIQLCKYKNGYEVIVHFNLKFAIVFIIFMKTLGHLNE